MRFTLAASALSGGQQLDGIPQGSGIFLATEGLFSLARSWNVRIEVAPRLRDIQVPPLLLQPLVENAVKHGIGPTRDGGEVVVTARIDRIGGASPTLVLVVRDSGAGATQAELRRGRVDGVGLSNVERRLACQYGTAAAGLAIESAPGLGTSVEIRLPAERAAAAEVATGKRTA